MITEEQFNKQFLIALSQRITIDKNKCENYAPVQGFIALGHNDPDMIIFLSFQFTTIKECTNERKRLYNLYSIQDIPKIISISFAQNYIHYSQ